MDSAKLQDWLQVIGVFGVMASLIFVGLQMRQAHEIALAAQYQARTASVQDMWMAMLQGGYDMSVIGRPRDELTNTQWNHSYMGSAWVWYTLDNLHYQHSVGFLPDEAWEGAQQIVLDAWDRPVSRDVFNSFRPNMRRSFVEFVEQKVRDAGEPT